jgi:hypothetical protein
MARPVFKDLYGTLWGPALRAASPQLLRSTSSVPTRFRPPRKPYVDEPLAAANGWYLQDVAQFDAFPWARTPGGGSGARIFNHATGLFDSASSR